MSKYFGTNGVRGRFYELTPELALKLAQSIGLYFKSGKIIVAQDCRITGEILRSTVIAGLASVGCSVIDIGTTSSPTAEFMVKKLKADGLIIVTASHNPPEWNALKVVDGNGVAVSRERGESIEAFMDKITLADWNKVGSITRYEKATDDHIEAICKLVSVRSTKKKTLVLDCGNGTAALIAPKLLSKLGAQISLINEVPDGHFPGRPSEPTETNVKKLIDLIKSSKADAGIAWDGDGDRVIFVDEQGNYVIGDKVFALAILWKLSKSKGDIVTTVATSKAAEDVATQMGSKVRFTAIGVPYLNEEMMRSKAALGGEEVGGVIFPELSMAKDGFLVAAKLLEALYEKPLSAWLKEIPIYYNVKLKIEASTPQQKGKIVSGVLAYAKQKKLKIQTIDGVRIDFPDSWVIVRASGTENYVRVFAEAKSKEKAEELANEYKRIALE